MRDPYSSEYLVRTAENCQPATTCALYFPLASARRREGWNLGTDSLWWSSPPWKRPGCPAHSNRNIPLFDFCNVLSCPKGLWTDVVVVGAAEPQRLS